MRFISYNREAATAYARRWATGRNPSYYDFERIGGDCTNFTSQCLYEGCGVMNYTPVTGWFYRFANDRSASWTGVEFFYNFLTDNESVGPFGEVYELGNLEIGDIVQLGRFSGDFYHSLIVTDVSGGRIRVASHSFNTYNKPLDEFVFEDLRCIHITGARQW